MRQTTELPHIDDDTPGMTLEQMEFIFNGLCGALQVCCNDDGKQRHFLLMVVTRDSVDEDDGTPNVTTDIASTMTAEDVHQTMRDWLHRKTQ